MKKIFRTVAFVLALGSLSAGFTACGDDDTKNAIEDLVSVDEVIDVANLKIKANADGTITFVGDVESNAKIKTFQLIDQSGNVKYDFVASNDQVKEKLKDIAEDGTVTKEKVFSLKNITSDKIAVDLYTLVIKTKKANTEAALGEVLDYTIGASGSKTGSYLSIVNNDAFDQSAAETEKSAEVIAVSSTDGYTVEGLKRASEAKSDKVVARAGKVALFDATGASATQINKGGVIITESGCICKINELTNTSTSDATVKAVTIKKNDKLGITVDVSGYNFSK